MTYQEWLAGTALQGALATSSLHANAKDIATPALKAADALIEKLAEKTEPK